jgi:hypothetical protein
MVAPLVPAALSRGDGDMRHAELVGHGLAAVHHCPAAARDQRFSALLPPYRRERLHRYQRLAHVFALLDVVPDALLLGQPQGIAPTEQGGADCLDSPGAADD